MKKDKVLILAYVLLLMFILDGCGRKIAVSSSDKLNKDNSDNGRAEFNYSFSEGLRQKLSGNLTEALQYFEDCTRIDPGSDAAFYEMAEITLANGNLEAGKKYIRKTVEIDGSNIWYLTMISTLYYNEKDYDSCIIYYEKALSIYPERDEIRLQLGTVYSETGNFKKAVEVFSYLDDKFGINEGSTVLKARSLILSGEYDEAEKVVKTLMDAFPGEVLYAGLMAEILGARGDGEKALEVYDQLLETYPDNSQVQLSLLDYLHKEKRYDDLTIFLNRIMINGDLDKDSKASVFMSLLEDTALIHGYAQSFEVTALLLESQYAGDETITLLKPELYIKAGKLPEAIGALESYIKSFPDNYYGWERLLFLYSETRDFDKLYAKGRECAAKFNRSVVAKVLYASAATEVKEYSTALEELRKATILANDDKDIMIQINSMEADVYYRMKDFDNSFLKYDELVSSNPDNLMILNNYAYYLAEQNRDLNLAEKMSEKTIAEDETNATFLDTYAWVLYKKGNLRAAEKVMDSIFSLAKPVDAEYYEHYGFILKAMNKCGEAVRFFNDALAIDKSKESLRKEIEDCGRTH